MARYTRRVSFSYNTVTAFAAACAAYRINGAYYKEDVNSFNDEGEYIATEFVANKVLMRQFLSGEYDITDVDIELANKVMTFCRGLSMKILMGKPLSEFQETMLAIVDKEVITNNYDLAVIASLPASYYRDLARYDVDVRLRESNGALKNNVGDKVNINVEVVRCNYSRNYDIFYVTCITGDNHNVFFAHKNNVEVGKMFNVAGKIKCHKEDRTQLTRVKFR